MSKSWKRDQLSPQSGLAYVDLPGLQIPPVTLCELQM
jgi:hypothetical protein